MMAMNGWWVWTSIPQAATVNDITILNGNITEISAIMTDEDQIIADRGFAGAADQLQVTFGAKHRAAVNLPPFQKEELREISEQRGDILNIQL